MTWNPRALLGKRQTEKSRKLMELKKDNAALQTERERLRSEYDEYRTQLISRREELVLKSAEDENQ